ncbi:Uncharacterized protein OS=Planctomyces maris DSM 8797 GN=PM8797T_02084 PE=4 SV=1: PT-HINT [Tuwongella immobilis]|uniref:Uncharacterized protein n=2 Tax=Tuwongella immobilis TaxID=692036 RepID=A0A6C2YRJ6_9BACT|nr:Uncharacterized protein OS=Planctomyces maris DSM 8797 GN=PM8797T_02084 PE=4 SV=1: PT-HINT [Tuwongella immobilis]VTS04854.1 Uncharacterized protein OS=Planctomyces maris DSM 8797 GN=PM8797T_02084 PE=4 SV=1: PT-HINT [Tuwongella immobilis]
MGAKGDAIVTAIEACPEIAPGRGRLVVSRFRHSQGEVYDLRLVGSDVIIGVTAHHPLWSATRGAWVSAAELEPGEHLRGIGEGAGVVVEVESLLPRGQEPVYNIEVDGDHCYRVGEQGLLVHNASVGPISAPSSASNCCPEVVTATTTEFELVNTAKQSNFILGELNGGELSFIIENKPKNTPQDGCFGKWMFEEMWKHFGVSVKILVGKWTGSDSDNLKEFNQLLSQGKTEMEAAWGTWTGKRAIEKGFKNVSVASRQPSGGPPFTSVEVRFTY